MGFALSKLPHLHRAYLVTVCNRTIIAVSTLEKGTFETIIRHMLKHFEDGIQLHITLTRNRDLIQKKADKTCLSFLLLFVNKIVTVCCRFF